MSTEIYDLKDYRQSKIIAKDLEEIRNLIRISYKDLTKYKKYLPIKAVLDELLNAEIVCKQFHKKHSEILKRKGRL